MDYRNYFSALKYINLGKNNAGSVSQYLEVEDLNKDGLPEIFILGATYPIAGNYNSAPQQSSFFLGSGLASYSATQNNFVPSTTHPRNVFYADFNNDGKEDVFIIDHGWDASPFPGALSQLILSSGATWTNASAKLPQVIGFTHCAAVGDINGDGNQDIFMGAMPTSGSGTKPFISFGDGLGNFVLSNAVLPVEIQNASTVFYATKLEDLNNDGLPELIIGNAGYLNNQTSQSMIYWNTKGAYSDSNKSLLPNGYFGVKNEQILDIQAADLDGDGAKEIVMISTQNNPFYAGWSLQILKDINGKYVDVTENSFGLSPHYEGTPGIANTKAWLTFIKLLDINFDGNIDIVFDRMSAWNAGAFEARPIFYLNDGFSHFTSVTASDVLKLDNSNQDFFASGARVFMGKNGPTWISQFTSNGSLYLKELDSAAQLPGLIQITGTENADKINANTLNNLLRGSGGNDTIDGGTGIDTAIYSGIASQYQTATGTRATITDKTTNRDGTDTLTNVERLKFTDTNVALDVGPTQNAGSVYMIYKAAFNRAPDASGMGYWLAQKDNGSNIVTNIAQGFVNSAEFTAKYGTNPTNASYIDKLYQNVLGRSGDSGGIAYWNQELDAGRVSKAAALAAFATLPEGASNVASLIANGIPYTEFVG